MNRVKTDKYKIKIGGLVGLVNNIFCVFDQ